MSSPVARPRTSRHGTTRTIIAALAVVVVLLWGFYKVSSARPSSTAMVADSSCHTDPTTVADMSRVHPGASSVGCESWDVGTGVTGYSWQAPQPRGVVLFQHGWGDYAQRWVQQADELIPHLLDEGFSVYAFDMYGNGRSPGARGVVDVDQAVQDHLAARRLLGEQPVPVFLMGHSLGGLVTATSMVTAPDDLAGVVLLAPAVKYDVGAPLRLAARVGGFLAPTLPAPLSAGPPISSDPAVMARLERDPLMVMRPMNWLTAAGGATTSHANFDRYPHVRVPVLAIHGTADGSTDPTGSSDLIDALASPDKTFVPIEGGQHALLDDTRADQTLTVVLDWLAARASQSSQPAADG